MMCGTSLLSRIRMTCKPRLISHSFGLPIKEPSVATSSSRIFSKAKYPTKVGTRTFHCGSRIVNTAPPPKAFAAVSVPPCSVITRCAKARPMP